MTCVGRRFAVAVNSRAIDSDALPSGKLDTTTSRLRRQHHQTEVEVRPKARHAVNDVSNNIVVR